MADGEKNFVFLGECNATRDRGNVVYCCGRATHVAIPGMYWTELLDLTSSPTQYILSAAQFDEKVDG